MGFDLDIIDSSHREVLGSEIRICHFRSILIWPNNLQRSLFSQFSCWFLVQERRISILRKAVRSQRLITIANTSINLLKKMSHNAVAAVNLIKWWSTPHEPRQLFEPLIIIRPAYSSLRLQAEQFLSDSWEIHFIIDKVLKVKQI